MRLKLIIDGYYHEIDSTDPELLARWIMEIFGRMREITPATQIQVQAQPSWLPCANPAQPWAADWTADGRIIGQTVAVRSPRELLDALGKQLDEAEALTP